MSRCPGRSLCRLSRAITALTVLVLTILASGNGASAHQAPSEVAPNGRSPWYSGESWTLTRHYGTGTHNDYVNGSHYNDYYALDFANGCLKRLYAIYDGMTVYSVNATTGRLDLRKTINGRRYKVKYMHMDRILVQPGMSVGTNTLVGYAGNRGNSTGCHLHLAVHVKRSDGVWLAIKPRFCGREYPNAIGTSFRGC